MRVAVTYVIAAPRAAVPHLGMKSPPVHVVDFYTLVLPSSSIHAPATFMTLKPSKRREVSPHPVPAAALSPASIGSGVPPSSLSSKASWTSILSYRNLLGGSSDGTIPAFRREKNVSESSATSRGEPSSSVIHNSFGIYDGLESFKGQISELRRRRMPVHAPANIGSVGSDGGIKFHSDSFPLRINTAANGGGAQGFRKRHQSVSQLTVPKRPTIKRSVTIGLKSAEPNDQ